MLKDIKSLDEITKRVSMRTKTSKLRVSQYGQFTILVGGIIMLGLNFLFLKPTFNPLGIPKGTFGIIFLAVGVVGLIFLNFAKPRLVKMVMAVAASLLLFYSALLVIQFFQLKQTSLQLPITYTIISLLGLYSLTEPSVNPLALKKGKGNGLPK